MTLLILSLIFIIGSVIIGIICWLIYTKKIIVKIQWRWFDLWIGFYYSKKKKTLYFCLIPTVPISIRKGTDEESKKDIKI